MKRPVAERIDDILASISRCLAYSRDIGSGDSHVAQMAVDATERNIAIIGEAANHLPAEVTGALPDVDWSAIRGMRNVLVHEYFGVDGDVVDTKLRPLGEALARYRAELRHRR